MLIKTIIEKVERRYDAVKYWKRKGCQIGDNCEIYPTANLGSEPYLISIGNHVRINDGVQLITHDGGMWVLRGYSATYQNADRFGRITIGNNVHIGTNSIIMPGVTVGDNVIIGCGSIVTKSIPSFGIVAGIPAKFIETIDEYSQKHVHDIVMTKNFSVKEKERFLLSYYNSN